MKTKTRITLIALVFILVGAYLFLPPKDSHSILGGGIKNEENKKFTPSGPGPITFNQSFCTLQPNRAYICKAEALGNFAPQTVKDTTTGNTCTVSYNSTSGFEYSSKTRKLTISPGDMATELLEAKGIINLARSAGVSINIRLVPNGVIDYVMVVDKNYAVERCLVLQ